MKDLITSFNTHPNKKSLFLSFEGIEGAGKSYQIKKISESLQKKKFNVKIYREPGSTSFGEKLRKAIIESTEKIHPLAEAMLFASARTQLLEQKILKDLNEDRTIVICDRYIDSSIAYQGFARNLGVETIVDLHKHSPLNVLPHLTFYLKISVECSFQRQKIRNQNKDYFEKEDKSFYQKLAEGYDKAAQLFCDRIQIINGEAQAEHVGQEVLKCLEKTLKNLD